MRDEGRVEWPKVTVHRNEMCVGFSCGCSDPPVILADPQSVLARVSRDPPVTFRGPAERQVHQHEFAKDLSKPASLRCPPIPLLGKSEGFAERNQRGERSLRPVGQREILQDPSASGTIAREFDDDVGV